MSKLNKLIQQQEQLQKKIGWLALSFIRGEFNYRLAGCLVAGGGLLAVAGRVGQWVVK